MLNTGNTGTNASFGNQGFGNQGFGNQGNPIDDLVDEFDDNEIHGQTSGCCKCSDETKKLFPISCQHLICLDCIEELIDEGQHKKCPLCQSILTKNLHKIFSEFLINPVSKLSYYYDFNLNDKLWCYTGNGHNWLYTKEQCDEINDAMDSDNPCFELNIKIGNHMETYVIDFDDGVQYPKNNPNKRRSIWQFQFNSLSDLKKNKIIGVAGKIL